MQQRPHTAKTNNNKISVQFSSVAQSCPTLCNTMDRSTPGFPVHHWLPEFTQTHVHRVGDAIQPSHPLSSPSPPTLSLLSLFQWVSSSHQVAKVLEFQLQHQSFQWIFRTDPLGWTGWISLQSKGLSRVSSNTTVKASSLWCSAFFMFQVSHPYMTARKTTALTTWTFVSNVMALLFNTLSRWKLSR